MIAEDLRRYLQDSRDSVMSTLDGLGEYDVRRPLVPSGTNRLGLGERHSDESIAELPLDAPASVGWWPEERRVTTFGHLLVRVVAETAQHAGHCDVVRELIDGRSAAAVVCRHTLSKVRSDRFRSAGVPEPRSS